MPQRSFKSMFVELVSFLTLFSLVGTMSSNFWERYLIQTELSNMKSSLHALKETIYNIGTAYDNLHHELKGLVEMREMKSCKSMPKESKSSPYSNYRNNYDPNIFNNNHKAFQELAQNKANKSTGITASKGIDSRPTDQEGQKFAMQNVTTATRNPLKSTGINSELKVKNLDYQNNNDENNLKENEVHTQIHKCCKYSNCCT